LKGIAIGLSNNSKEILKRLKKTEFVKEIYIAGSSKEMEREMRFFKYKNLEKSYLRNGLR